MFRLSRENGVQKRAFGPIGACKLFTIWGVNPPHALADSILNPKNSTRFLPLQAILYYMYLYALMPSQQHNAESFFYPHDSSFVWSNSRRTLNYSHPYCVPTRKRSDAPTTSRFGRCKTGIQLVSSKQQRNEPRTIRHVEQSFQKRLHELDSTNIQQNILRETVDWIISRSQVGQL